MGAENSVLAGCEWGPPVDCPPKFPWEISPITKPDGTSATVFETKISDNKDEDLLRKSASTLRGLRHPNIIRFIGCGHSSDGFWLATESVLPLFLFVSDMSSHELCAGLFDLLQGLDFLHSKLGVCHNNICLSSVYVSNDGTWKIGGLELACRFTEATQDFLDRCRAFRHEDCLSPEEKTGRVTADGSLGHARDVFAFGALVEVVLDLVKDKDSCAQMLEQQLFVCLHPEPASRPQVSILLNMSVFTSDLIEILKFLRHITVKTDADKEDFFINLMSRLCQLPEMAIARRLVLPLLARFVLLDERAVTRVLPHLLTPKGSSCRKSTPFVQGLLPEHLFRQYVINHVYNIFHVYDCHVRLVLLEHFSHYVNMFTRQQLEDDIFLQILLGVRDTDDRLVAASLRALADLVPVLGGDIVVGGVRKPFFFHGIPKISSQNLAKMNVPQNMMAVLTDHKPLLKNLAATSNHAIAVERNLAAAEERKIREREQRREEARMKREERRNQLKEKQTDKKQVNSVHADRDGDGQMLGLTIEQVRDFDDEEVTLKSTTDSNADDHDDLTSIVMDINNLGRDSKAPDWSDWEDADQQISDEIEMELRAMPGAEPKVQTSPNPYRSHSPPSPPPVRMNWSDEVDRTKSMPTIRAGDSSQTGATSGQTNREHKLDHGPVSSDTLQNDTRSTKLHGKTKTGPDLIQKTTPNPLSSSNEGLKLNGTSTKHQAKKVSDKRVIIDDLGAGLDVKSINIVKKSTPPELDFFADMAPSIPELRPSDLTSLLESRTAESVEESKSASSSPTIIAADVEAIRTSSEMFAVSAVSEEEVKGWSEDDVIDWENEVPST